MNLDDILGIDSKLISYGSRDPKFNNRAQFPSFYRTIPDELSEIYAIVRLIKHFGWKWVGLIVSDDKTQPLAGKNLEREMKKDGVCLAFFLRINSDSMASSDSMKIKKTLRSSSANVIVILTSLISVEFILFFFAVFDMPEKIWIVSSTFLKVLDTTYPQNRKIFNGALVVSFQQGEIPGFREFLHGLNPSLYENGIFFPNISERLSNCDLSTTGQIIPNRTSIFLPKCMESQFFYMNDMEFNDTLNFRISYGVYTAVYKMALALHKLYIKYKVASHHDRRASLQTHFKQWQDYCVCYLVPERNILGTIPEPVDHNVTSSATHVQVEKVYLLNAMMQSKDFEMITGDKIHWKFEQDPSNRYELLKCFFSKEGGVQVVKVGSVDTTKSAAHLLHIDESADLWGPYFTKFPQSLCNEPCVPGYRKSKIEGRPPCCYQCVLCSEGEMSNTTDAQSCMKCSEYEKSNKERNGCIPKNINFLSYKDQLGATLSSIAVMCSIICGVILGIFIKYRETPTVRANNRNLSCLLLISLMLCFLCTLLFIGRPTKICCLLRQVTFGIVFTISVSSVLAKTLTVIIAFNATKPGSKLKKYVGTKQSVTLVIAVSLGETIISALWVVISPPLAEADTLSDQDYIFLQCNEGSDFFFFCIIGYIGTLALLSFIAAFLAKDFPDRFNEAKNITFSMLVFCSVWVTFVPAYLSSKGSRMVAVEIFAILSSSSGILGCIFIPKCYIIFLRPELNTKDTIVRK
ncbi:vomeronasal type-2 receptor 116 [Xenopus laevis]|uniref:Vomeronasal type-2 receptor 116 n=1 Tax=Xenopus laevis TaxID=8355 RepID=A0A8J1KU55_XENLA|nr:vomeronasal type-2 receptor 116 [Xenopus laevis]